MAERPDSAGADDEAPEVPDDGSSDDATAETEQPSDRTAGVDGDEVDPDANGASSDVDGGDAAPVSGGAPAGATTDGGAEPDLEPPDRAEEPEPTEPLEDDGDSDGSDGSFEKADAEVADPDELDDLADEDEDDGLLGPGPESDEEMPLADHIEEMMQRLGIVFLVAGVVTVVAYPLSPDLVNYLWGTHIPEPGVNRPRLYGPLEFILTKLKVAGLAGLVAGLPVFVYQTYRFMRPGLYYHERRYYLAAVPTSLVLGIVGVLFSHFLVLPFIFSYFTTYTTGAAEIAFGLQETFNLILVMMGFMAVIFQIPLFIMLAIMMGVVTRRWLENKRLIFWGTFLGIAFIASPDPTGMAPIIVTITMIILYEGTLALLRWTGN